MLMPLFFRRRSISFPRHLVLAIGLVGAGGCEVASPNSELGGRVEALLGAPVIVNECMTGTAGWVELLNRGAVTVDLGHDPATCWYVDDSAGGGAPKGITDSNVNHPDASPTCAAAGRGPACALIAPGEHVWVKVAYINSVTPDECRLLSAPRAGENGACGATQDDVLVGGATASSAAGQCFGRAGDGGPWGSASLACTPGSRNPGGDALDAASAPASDAAGEAPIDAGAGAGPADGPPADGPTIPAAGPPVLARLARRDRVRLTGTIVTADAAFEGELLIEGDTITCVAPSCADSPGAADASLVETNGIVLPGLIDTHNHILFDIFDETDWSPAKRYTNHNQWPNEPRYKAMVDAKQYLNGEAGSPVSIGCEMDKYGELKALVAGTTSVVGAANPSNRSCYGSLARTIDQSANDLPDDKVQVATLFPTASAADGVCRNLTDGSTDAYLVHVSEGVDASALGELGKLWTASATTPGCLFSPRTTIVHGTAFGAPEMDRLAAAGMSLVWSPRSNVFLYGGGTDLTKTANIPLARAREINVALAPDWSIGGSQNLLDELRFADQVDNTVWGDGLSPRALFEMVTINAARALGLDASLGSLAPGKKADILVIGGDRTRPYDALLAATPAQVRLVTVGGAALYGDPALLALADPAAVECEAVGICGASKFVCVAEAGGTEANKLGQTLSEIEGVIAGELQRYDDLGLTAWAFSPITPLVRCAP